MWAEGKAREKEIWDLVTEVVCALEERVWKISFRRELHTQDNNVKQLGRMGMNAKCMGECM